VGKRGTVLGKKAGAFLNRRRIGTAGQPQVHKTSLDWPGGKGEEREKGALQQKRQIKGASAPAAWGGQRSLNVSFSPKPPRGGKKMDEGEKKHRDTSKRKTFHPAKGEKNY